MLKSTVSALAMATMFSTVAMADESLSEKAGDVMHSAEAAVTGSSIAQLGETGEVVISGEVKAIDTIDNEFTLVDDSGEIDVEQESDLAVKVGDKVVVSGTLTEDMGEKEVAASKVTVTTHAEDAAAADAEDEEDDEDNMM